MTGETAGARGRLAKVLASKWLPVAFSALFAGIFIARSAFVVNGEVYFSLTDDPMISMRYGRNLAEGHGLVWNPGGAPVEGYTNLLWTLWMAVLHLCHPPDAKASLLVMLSGAVLLALNVLAIRRVAVAIAPAARLAPLVACWLVAMDHDLVYWTLRGFEVGLVTLEVSIAVSLAVELANKPDRRRLALLSLVMALGALTRDDTVPMWLAIAAYVGIAGPKERGRARLWPSVVLACAVLGAFAGHVLFRRLYYGAPLPNTYYLKLDGTPLLFRVRRGLRMLAETGMFCLPVPLGVAVGSLARRPKSPGVYLLAALFAVQCAYSAFAGGDAFENELLVNRFLTFALPCFLVLVALGLESLLEEGPGARARVWSIGAFALAGLACLWNARSLVHFAGETDLRVARITAALVGAVAFVCATRRRRRRGVTLAAIASLVVCFGGPALLHWARSNALWLDEDSIMARYGVRLGAATSPDASIAVTWAGAIPYFARRTAVDLFGKCDPVIAHTRPPPAAFFAPGHDRWNLTYSIGTLRPDVVAQLADGGAELKEHLSSWGYARIGPEMFVREGSRAIDLEALKHATCAIPWGDSYLCGHFGDPPEEWRGRWERECEEKP